MGLERTWIGVRLRGRQEGVGHIEASGIPKSPSPFHFLSCSFPQLVEGNFALFCTYTLGFRNEFQNLLLAIMVRTGRMVLMNGSLDSWRILSGCSLVMMG